MMTLNLTVAEEAFKIFIFKLYYIYSFELKMIVLSKYF